MKRFFPELKIMLSNIRRANANDTHSDVWSPVEIYTFDTTPGIFESKYLLLQLFEFFFEMEFFL